MWFSRDGTKSRPWADRQDKTRLHHYLWSDTSCIECFLHNTINVLSMKVLSQRRNHTTISRKIMPIGHTLVGTMVMVYQSKLFVIRGVTRGEGAWPPSVRSPASLRWYFIQGSMESRHFESWSAPLPKPPYRSLIFKSLATPCC